MGTFVSKDETSLTTSVNTLTGCTVPASGLAGDLLLGIWGSDSTQTAALDAAYTSEDAGADGAARAIAFSKVATGSESGDLSLSSTPTANRQAAAIARYRGFSGITRPISAANETLTDTTHTSPDITPTVDGSGIVLLYVERVTSTALPITPPAGFTLRSSFSTGGSGGVAVAIADKLTGNLAGVLVTPGDWTGTTPAGACRMYAVELLPSGGTVTGVAQASFALTATAAGVRTVKGAAVSSAALTAVAAGLRTVRGAAAADVALTATAVGRRSVFGQARADLVLLATLLGLRTVKGAAQASSALTATAAGEVPASTLRGSISGPVADVPGGMTQAALGVAGDVGGAPGFPGSIEQETFNVGGILR